jgi:hypothetical protein
MFGHFEKWSTSRRRCSKIRNTNVILSRIVGTVKKSTDLTKVVEEKLENWNALIPLRESLLHHRI